MKDPTPEELSAKYTAIADMQERRKVFLDDVASFYTSENRATSGQICLYQATKTSPGCAIGRCIPDKLRPNTGGVSQNEVYNVLPLWMREMGQDFLADIQRLHDSTTRWNAEGLSADGVKFVAWIKEAYNL